MELGELEHADEPANPRGQEGQLFREYANVPNVLNLPHSLA